MRKELSPAGIEWFRSHYAHSTDSFDLDSAVEAVMEDWTFYDAVQGGKIRVSDLPAIPAFRYPRHWRLRINTGLHFVGLQSMKNEDSREVLAEWLSAAKKD